MSESPPPVQYPLLGSVVVELESVKPEKEHLPKLREMLVYFKVCGVHAAQVYTHYREMEEEWAREAAGKAENDLIEISRCMQRVMNCITSAERMDACRDRAMAVARARSLRGEIPIGELEAHAHEEEPLYQFFAEQRGAVEGESTRYTRATLRPFTEMWKECMELIDPGEEFDIQMFLGEDPVFSTTVFATSCPISKEPLRDVVRTPCNHRFNRASFVAFAESADGRFKCPIGGCSRVLGGDDFVSDGEYEARALESVRRRREQSVATLV